MRAALVGGLGAQGRRGGAPPRGATHLPPRLRHPDARTPPHQIEPLVDEMRTMEVDVLSSKVCRGCVSGRGVAGGGRESAVKGWGAPPTRPRIPHRLMSTPTRTRIAPHAARAHAADDPGPGQLGLGGRGWLDGARHGQVRALFLPAFWVTRCPALPCTASFGLVGDAVPCILRRQRALQH